MMTNQVMKLTRSSLAARAAKLADDIDEKRWEAARLAADGSAQSNTIPDWAHILAVAFRRERPTIYGWARTAEWVKTARLKIILPFSFYDVSERYSDKLPLILILESLATWAATPGATVKSFAAHLHNLAEPDDGIMDIHKAWLEKESAKLRRKANDYGMPAFMRDGLLLAADTLDDTKNKVVMA